MVLKVSARNGKYRVREELDNFYSGAGFERHAFEGPCPFQRT
jgi:hypothetical protein